MPVHAFIFPGQGSQAVGMGRDLAAAFPAAREVFEEVDDTLGQRLSKLMFEGPGEELVLTENTQPALMAHSLAVLRVLEKEGGFTLRQKAVVVAGHSLGEYSALAAAGSFSVAANIARSAPLMAWMVSVQRRVFAGGSATTAAELKSTCCSVISACVSVEVGCELTSFSRLSSSSGPDVVAMSVI